MIKLSASAVEGFLGECYRKGYTEKEATCLLETSINTSDALFTKSAEETKSLAILTDLLSHADINEEVKKLLSNTAPEAKSVAEGVDDIGKTVADVVPKVTPTNVATSETDNAALIDKIKTLVTNEKKEEDASIVDQIRAILTSSTEPKDTEKLMTDAVDGLSPEVKQQIISNAEKGTVEAIRDSYLNTHDKYRPFYNVMTDQDHLYVNKPYEI